MRLITYFALALVAATSTALATEGEGEATSVLCKSAQAAEDWSNFALEIHRFTEDAVDYFNTGREAEQQCMSVPSYRPEIARWKLWADFTRKDNSVVRIIEVASPHRSFYAFLPLPHSEAAGA